jgi:hypothetical protein
MQLPDATGFELLTCLDQMADFTFESPIHDKFIYLVHMLQTISQRSIYTWNGGQRHPMYDLIARYLEHIRSTSKVTY